MTAEDEEALFEFFSKVPEEDRAHLRDDVTRRELIGRWAKDLRYDQVLPILALVEGKIVADATLHQRRFGWKRHLGIIRVVVARDYQHLGIGRLLIEDLCSKAADFGLEQVIAEVPAGVKSAVAAFKRAGFTRAAVLEGLVKDQHGETGDVAVMTRKVFPTYDI